LKNIATAALFTLAALTLPLANLPGDAHAEDAPDENLVVRSVEMEGLVRIDKQAVRSRIYTQVGRELDRGRLSEDLKRLYALGFFSDIQVAERPHPDGGLTLLFRFIERPTVLAVEYAIEGDSVEKEDIEKIVDIKPLEILDEAQVKANISKIKELFVEEGHFLVDAGYELLPFADNQVKVRFIVREGSEVEVRRVEIVGNKELKSEEIESILGTREGSYFGFLTQAGEFKKELFEQDLQRVQYLYLTKGFVQVRVGEPSVTLTPDKKAMDIVIPVEEGPRYRTGALDVEMVGSDDFIVPKSSLLSRLTLKTGEWFDYAQMQADTANIASVYRDRGYANANVSSENKIDPEKNTFGVVFKVQKGDLVRIRRIEVRGNRDTRDKVIRREMKILEGDLYSGEKIRRSQRRIMALGFFEPPSRPGEMGGVQIDTRPTGDPRTVDLVVTVKEKQTGTFQVGAGFSSFESFLLTAQIQKENIFGRGQTISAQLTLSGIRQLGSLSFYEPYFFDSPVTFAFDLFNYNEAFTDFTRLRQGGNVTFGYRLTDDLSLSLTYTLESVDAELNRTDIDIQALRQAGFTSSLRATGAWDTRDNRLFPTDGQYTTLSLEYASSLLGSENEFWRVIGRTRWYFPLFWEFVLRLNGTVGVVEGLDGQTVPLFERFFVGGIFTVRGFERNAIGERLYITSQPDGDLSPITVGGIKQLILNAEIEFPIFKEVGIRGVVFMDAGNAWGGDATFDPFDLRTSAGFGFRWNSPVGPLRFEWGFPLAPRPGEDSSVFEFTIGNSF
jgi:outer membrane protein insertion porin family